MVPASDRGLERPSGRPVIVSRHQAVDLMRHHAGGGAVANSPESPIRVADGGSHTRDA
jgi:hypothetical protein